MNIDKTIENMYLDGGCMCFDFVNTVHSRRQEPQHDYLTAYTDLLTLCARTETMPAKRLDTLKNFAKSNPQEANETLEEIIKYRELLYQLFTKVAAAKPIGREVLNQFNVLLSKSLSKIRLVADGVEVEKGWNESKINLKEPVWRIIKSGYDILMEQPQERIKECEACGWLFLDQSKNRSRRWCNMQTCGSAYKAKKYYHRKKKKEG